MEILEYFDEENENLIGTEERDIVLLINNTDQKPKIAFGEIGAYSFYISVNGGVVIHG